MYFVEKDDLKEQSRKKEYEEYYSSNIAEAKKEAETLNLDALMFLGVHYSNDRNPDYDPVAGYHYLLRAYHNHYPDAALFLGKMTLEGKGTEKDVDRAIDYYSSVLNDQSYLKAGALSELIRIYLSEDGYVNEEKATRYLYDLIQDSLFHQDDFFKANQVTNEQYPDENEFRYHFEENEKTKVRYQVLNDAVKKIENNDSSALDELNEEFLEESSLGNIVYSYCYASGTILPKDMEQCRKYFYIAYQRSDKLSQQQLLKMDLASYIPYCLPSSNDQLINPYGYTFNEEDMKDYIKEQKKEAEYNIVKAILFLAYGSIGRFKYFPVNYDDAIEYFSQAKSLGFIDANIHLANIYHDGLLGFTDKEKAFSLLDDIKEKSDDALLYLALYELIDHNNKDAAGTYLLTYAEREMDEDLALVDDYHEHKDEIKDKNTLEYLTQNEAGSLADKEGLTFLMKKDYDKAVEYFTISAKDNEMTEGAIHMAYCYLFGYGVEENIDTAITIIKEVLAIDMM